MISESLMWILKKLGLGRLLYLRKKPPLVGKKELQIFSIANHKGGVGKTTTAITLSAILASMGQKVLLIDLDPQANSTLSLGINGKKFKYTISDFLKGNASSKKVVIKTQVNNLYLIPSTIHLADTEISLVGVDNREEVLKNAIQDLMDDYDYIFIDCPPSLGLLSLNGITASDSVIIPVQCEYYSLKGIEQFMDIVSLIQDRLNPSLEIDGILFTMYDKKIRHTNKFINDVRNSLHIRVYDTMIPRDDLFPESSSFGKPITVAYPDSHGSKAYQDLAQEFLQE